MDQPDAAYVDPCCILCGALVGFRELYGGGPRGFSDEPVEIDNKSPAQWGSIYRAIFKTKPDAPFRLSGIGRWDACEFASLKVTWETDSSNITMPQRDYSDHSGFIHLVNFVNQYNRHEDIIGYIVHANCWELLERRFLGPRVRENFDLLLDICYERFCENPYDIHEFWDPDGDEKISKPTEGWEPPEGAFFSKKSRLDLGNSDDSRTRNVICLRDPLRIPEITRLIQHSIHNKGREAVKRKSRSCSSVSFKIDGERPRSSNFQQIAQLPLEIIFMILDNLSKHGDIRNVLTAFSWKIPDLYWEQRVPKDLIFELEDVSCSSNMDWRFFFLHICKMQEESPELKNRRRVLDLLEGIRTRFIARESSGN